MPNLGAVLETEVSRLAGNGVKSQVDTLEKTSGVNRREVAELNGRSTPDKFREEQSHRDMLFYEGTEVDAKEARAFRGRLRDADRSQRAVDPFVGNREEGSPQAPAGESCRLAGAVKKKA